MDRIVSELNPWRFEVTALSTEWSFTFEDDRFHPRLFCPSWEFVLDLRNVYATSGFGVEVIPAFQMAAVRVDRPDDPMTAGTSGATAAGLTHSTFTPSSIGQKGFFRRGVACRLTGSGATPFARATGIVYCSWRPLGVALPAEEIVVNPYNDNSEWAIFPLGRGRAIPARTLDKIGAMVIGQGNLTQTAEYDVFIRAFNDLQARGNWTAMGASITPTTTNFEHNHGEIALPQSITFTDFGWVELAYGLRKGSGNPSRCLLNVVPMVKYTG